MEKEVVPSPTPWCSSYRKGSLWVTLDYGRQLYLLYIYTYIYIYIYIYIQISLNITDIFCLHIFLWILSYCCIDFAVFGGNWLIYFPLLFISQVLSARLWAIIRGGCITKATQLLYVHYYFVRRRAYGPLQCVALTFKINRINF